MSEIVLDPIPTSYTTNYAAYYNSSPTFPSDLITFAMPDFTVQSNTLSHAGDPLIVMDGWISSAVPA